MAKVKEQAEKEAKEKAEKEAKNQAEREAREKEEKAKVAERTKNLPNVPRSSQYSDKDVAAYSGVLTRQIYGDPLQNIIRKEKKEMAQKENGTKDPNLGFEIVEESLDDLAPDEPQQVKE